MKPQLRIESLRFGGREGPSFDNHDLAVTEAQLFQQWADSEELVCSSGGVQVQNVPQTGEAWNVEAWNGRKNADAQAREAEKDLAMQRRLDAMDEIWEERHSVQRRCHDCHGIESLEVQTYIGSSSVKIITGRLYGCHECGYAWSEDENGKFNKAESFPASRTGVRQFGQYPCEEC